MGFAHLYARRSKKEAKKAEEGGLSESGSITAQVEACLALADKLGLQVAPDGIYKDDGYSGGSTRRPALQRLLASVKPTDTIIVWKLDRLSRNTRDGWNLVEEWFLKQNVITKSVMENVDVTTQEGRNFFTFHLMQAETERGNAKIRTYFSMKRRAENGTRFGGKAPYGYRQVGKHLWEVDEEAASVVRRLYSEYAAGKGVRTLVLELNQEGVPTPGPSMVWCPSQISYLLRNPIYGGKYRWGLLTNRGQYVKAERSQDYVMHDSPHPALIEWELWEHVQEIMARRKSMPPRHANTVNACPLLGILRCGRCGTPMTYVLSGRKGKPQKPSYRCARKQRSGMCDMPSILSTHMERTVLEVLEKYQDSVALEQALAESRPALAFDPVAERKRLQLQIMDRKRKIAKWDKAFEDDECTGAERLAHTNEHTQAIADLQAEIAHLESIPQPKPATALAQEFRTVVAAYDLATPAERKELLHGLISSVDMFVAGDDRWIEVALVGQGKVKSVLPPWGAGNRIGLQRGRPRPKGTR